MDVIVLNISLVFTCLINLSYISLHAVCGHGTAACFAFRRQAPNRSIPLKLRYWSLALFRCSRLVNLLDDMEIRQLLGGTISMFLLLLR